MWLISWFSKKPEDDDYEKVLASLALSISSKQTHLSEIRLRERRATLVVTLYAFGAWVLYLVLWWTILPGYELWRVRSRDERTLQSLIKAVPALAGPIFVMAVRRLVQAWYTRRGDHEEQELKSLMAEQRKKIDEIKKKTNYYTTKNLLDRYDEPQAATRKPVAPSTPNNNLRQRHVPPGGLGTPGGSPSPTAGPNRLMQNGTPSRAPALQALSPTSPQRQLLQQSTPRKMDPPRKQWYDRVADAILGDDEASTGAQHSRYALICDNCFSHNGLVRESQYEDMKYVCPKCGHFNPSPRMKREHADGGLPRTPASASFAPTQRSHLSREVREYDGSVSPPLTSPAMSRFSRTNSPGPQIPHHGSTEGLNTHGGLSSSLARAPSPAHSDASRDPGRGRPSSREEVADTSMRDTSRDADAITTSSSTGKMDVDSS